MNLKKFWAAAMMALALVSCNKDSELEPQGGRSALPNTKEVYVELGASQDYESDQMRAVFGLNNDPNSPDFGKTTGLLMSDKDVVLRVAVRQGAGQPIIQDIVFQKTDGRNHASYKGKITVPTGGTGNYTISSVLLREVGGAVFMTTGKEAPAPTAQLSRAEVLTQYNYKGNKLIVPAAEANKIEFNIPYVTHWQPIEVDEDAARSVVLKFAPQGTLVRMRIRNDHSAEKTFHRVKMVSTAFVHRGSYVISEERDGMPAWYPWNEETFYFTIPNGVTVAGKAGNEASYSPWMYVWLMPRKRDFVGRRTIASLGLSSSSDNRNYYPAFETNQELPQGSVPMTLVYNEGHQGFFGDLDDNQEWGSSIEAPKNPLLRVAERVLDVTGRAFVAEGSQVDDPNVGFFSFEEVVAMKSVQIGGKEYHAPSRNELAAILPPLFDKTGYGADRAATLNEYTRDVTEGSIQLGDLTKDFKADYYVAEDALYGLRFKDAKNKYRTAFRYKFLGTRDQADAILEISAVHVGNKLISIEDLKDPQFWANHADNVIIRRFPLYGSTNVEKSIRAAFGNTFIVFTATPYDEGAAYLSYNTWVTKAIINPYVTPGSLLRTTPVLLFTK